VNLFFLLMMVKGAAEVEGREVKEEAEIGLGIISFTVILNCNPSISNATPIPNFQQFNTWLSLPVSLLSPCLRVDSRRKLNRRRRQSRGDFTIPLESFATCGSIWTAINSASVQFHLSSCLGFLSQRQRDRQLFHRVASCHYFIAW